jgi:hypothetical protein
MMRFVCAALAAGAMTLAAQPAPGPAATFRQYCNACHGKTAQPMGGISVEKLAAESSVGENFQQWLKVAAALERNQMPPKGLPQPGEAQRRQAAEWIRAELASYIRKHEGDPGRVTARRLTSGEYDYTIRDLTGLDLNLERDLVADEAGGEGFTNFGDVQFLQDTGLERYLEVAKRVADHAVIGAGPLEFFIDPGKSGFEMSALARITGIYHKYGFRTVSGEGGRPFGLEKYGKAFYTAWRQKHRAALGETATLEAMAEREGITGRFARHVWSVLNRPSIGYPLSEVALRWRNLPAPGADRASSEKAAREGSEGIQKYLVTWPTWLFARGDLAAGGAGDESPLVFSDETLKATPSHRFVYPLGGRGFRRGPAPSGPAKVYLSVTSVNPALKPLVVWRNATVASGGFGGRGGGAGAAGGIGPRPPGPAAPQTRTPLRAMISPEAAAKLGFGRRLAGIELDPDDFVTEGPVMFEVPAPQGGSLLGLAMQAVAEIAGSRDQVVRITISDREDGGAARGNPTRALLGDPASEGYRTFKRGVMELAELMPPNSHGEPNPADKDPVPEPFDNTYNTPEHDAFVLKVKYQRNDRFLTTYGLDEAARTRLNHAWSDLFASFEYFDAYLGMLADHYKIDLNGKKMASMDTAAIEALPHDMRKYVRPLRAEYEAVLRSQAAGQPGHVEDCVKFASRAWRRPLTIAEQESLRAFYRARRAGGLDHVRAIRATLARILVSPGFLYRLERAPRQTAALSGWEVASRLSFFLWSSIPDEELRRAAAAGELASPAGIRKQVKRMVADPKARRLATEFFGQWLGFYRFDEYRGVDTSRFTEFTDEIKRAMYDEAVSFFEHVVRQDRPLGEILRADYTFMNRALAKFYGVPREIASDEPVMVEGANAFHRGGLLRLGAVLTATSAPLRTSPVKRGDWVLRRVLGTAVPPPPADAGSIPADEKHFGGLSLREKLEAHKRNPTCAGCHTRIDPLGFPLEKYDAVGRWREKYPDGKPVDDAAAMEDGEISGVGGLLVYLDARHEQVTRTLAHKLVGFALGRTIIASDLPLIDRMAARTTFSELAAEIAASRQFRYRRLREDTPSTVSRPSLAGAPAPAIAQTSLKAGAR